MAFLRTTTTPFSRSAASPDHAAGGGCEPPAPNLSICLLLVALAAGCGNGPGDVDEPGRCAVAASAPPTVRPTGTVDELVRVGDGRLHVRCVGAGATTVLLISGFNDGGDSWGEIEPALSQQARVCSYARFGTGTSDPPTRTQTFATSARTSTPCWRRSVSRGPTSSSGTPTGVARP